MSLTKRYILGLLCCIAFPLAAQEMSPEEVQYNLRVSAEIRSQLTRLNMEMSQLADDVAREGRISERSLQSPYYVRTMEGKTQSLTRRQQALDVRWEAFSASNLSFVADNDTLMEMVTHAQLLKQAIADSITAQQQRVSAIKDFTAAEQLINAQDSAYDKLYKQAFSMSFVQKLAPQLEKLKAQEQAQFAELQASYDKAKAAADLVPQLAQREQRLSDRFFGIKAQSDKIQQMKYQPLIQRIKDYIMGIAYVAIILIFINMISSKWQNAKKTKQAMEQQAEMLKKEHDYPTI